jgi:O-acetylserine/cysteine efflux transporter
VKTRQHTAIAALALAGALWGLSVPLSKLALGWLDPAWLAAARFLAAAPVLAMVSRRRLRPAVNLRVLAAGAVGFGAVVLLQNAGLQRTSVSHASVLVGTVPVLVALISAAHRRSLGRPLAWAGYALALGGIALVAGSAGSGASVTGDLLVLASAGLSAAMIVVQPRLLAGRDPAAVTAVQFAGGALLATATALLSGHAPAPAASPGPLLAFGALALAGTLLPFWLFALGQGSVAAHVAGAFVNLEPVVGAAIGWLAFGNPASPLQLAGATAVLAGVGLSSAPERARPEAPAARVSPVAGRLHPHAAHARRLHRPELRRPVDRRRRAPHPEAHIKVASAQLR